MDLGQVIVTVRTALVGPWTCSGRGPQSDTLMTVGLFTIIIYTMKQEQIMSVKITSGQFGSTIETDKFTLMIMSHSDGTVTIKGSQDLSMNMSKEVFGWWVADLSKII